MSLRPKDFNPILSCCLIVSQQCFVASVLHPKRAYKLVIEKLVERRSTSSNHRFDYYSNCTYTVSNASEQLRRACGVEGSCKSYLLYLKLVVCLTFSSSPHPIIRLWVLTGPKTRNNIGIKPTIVVSWSILHVSMYKIFGQASKQ